MGDADAEEVVRIGRAAGKASTAKYKAMQQTVSRDSRCRGMPELSRSRSRSLGWSPVQPQNFPRVGPDRDLPRVETLHEFLETRMSAREIVDSLEILGIEPLDTLSKALRSMFIAGPGNRLVGGDYSNIEGRLNAWISGEEWKLRAFREYDEGGPISICSHSKSFGVPVADVTKAQRQIGKVQELACGYQGSVGAYMNMAANYFIQPPRRREDCARRRVGRCVARGRRQVRIAQHLRARQVRLERPVRHRPNWRGAQVSCRGWWELQDAAVAAVGTPGSKHFAYDGRAAYVAANGFPLLPTPLEARVIAYAARAPDRKRASTVARSFRLSTTQLTA